MRCETQTSSSVTETQARHEQRLSQERHALEASIDRSYVGWIERRMENVTVSGLEALAGVLKVHVSNLFAEVEGSVSRPLSLPCGRKPKKPKASV